MTNSILEKVARFDFDKYYRPKVRIFCHLAMWLIFSLFIFANLRYGYGLNYEGAVLYMIRSLICNMSVFYLFFYVIIPYFLLRDKIAFTIFFFFVLILLWLILNHFCFYIIYRFVSIINVPALRKSLEYGANQSLFDVFSPTFIMAELMTVLYSISPFFFIKIVFSIAQFYSKSIKVIRRNNELEIEKLHIETEFLKAQLNPHFLFNTLNNLYGMSLRRDAQVPDLLVKLSGIMRYTLYDSNIDKVSLVKELEFIQSYVQLEKIRYKNNKKITMEVEGTELDRHKIAPLLTFIFIENAFKYGLKSKNTGFLEIKVVVMDKTFYFSIVNDIDSLGYLPNKSGRDVGGIGIENAKRRLELLYHNKYDLSVIEDSDCFRVRLQLEIE